MSTHPLENIAMQTVEKFFSKGIWRMRFSENVILGAASLLMIQVSQAVVIASQDFEGGQTTTLGILGGDADAGNAGNAAFPTAPGIVFDGVGLGWGVSIVANAPLTSDSDEDVIGVVDPTASGFVESFTLAGATGATGNFFTSGDSDGALTLTFNTVDATSFTGLGLSFSYAVSDTEFEPSNPSDFFDITVNGTTVFFLSGDDLEDIPASDSFVTENIDLLALGFDQESLTVVVEFNSNADAEEFGFDNLVIEGVVIPEPSTIGLAFLGLLAFCRRSRS